MVLCPPNLLLRTAAYRLVFNMQFSASVHYGSLWRSSPFQAPKLGLGCTVFPSEIIALSRSVSKARGHMPIPAARGFLLPAGRSCVFQQPWDRRGGIYLQGARSMGIFSVVRWFRKTRRRPALRKASTEKELELDVKICIEEDLPRDDEILGVLLLSFRVASMVESNMLFVSSKHSLDKN